MVLLQVSLLEISEYVELVFKNSAVDTSWLIAGCHEGLMHLSCTDTYSVRISKYQGKQTKNLTASIHRDRVRLVSAECVTSKKI